MHLYITGFLPDNDEDDLVKFDLLIDTSFNDQIVDLLGHTSLNAMAEGLWDLPHEQTMKISLLTGQTLPTDLELLIGVVA